MVFSDLRGLGKHARAYSALACLAIAAISHASWADDLHVTLEQYFTSQSGGHGITGDLRWAQIAYQPSPQWSFVGGWVEEWGMNELDENYVSYDERSFGAKVGRFRSAIGIYSWSDLHYTPIIALPVLKDWLPVGQTLTLYRIDRGAEVHFGGPQLEFKVSGTDSDDAGWQVLPRRTNTATGRLQFAKGQLILGLSGEIKGREFDDEPQKIADADFRWTSPRLILRGEAATGTYHGSGARGFFVDAFYRPQGLSRTQLGVRYQGVEDAGYDGYWGFNGDNTTVGVRQILNRYLTFDLNYGWGGGVPKYFNVTGWSAQLTTSYRF